MTPMTTYSLYTTVSSKEKEGESRGWQKWRTSRHGVIECGRAL